MGIHVSAQCDDCPVEPTTFYIEADNLTPVPGDEICYTISANGFQNVVSIQFSVLFTDATLSYVSDSRNLSGIPLFGDVFFPPYPNNNSYSVFWFQHSALPVCLPDSSALLELCFDVVGDPGEVLKVELGDFGQTPAEVGYVDGNSFSCPYVSTAVKVDIDQDKVPGTIGTECGMGPEIYATSICGTSSALAEGSIGIDVFCATAPYSLLIAGPVPHMYTVDDIMEDFVDVNGLSSGQHIIILTDATGDRSAPLEVHVPEASDLDILPLIIQDPSCFSSRTHNGRIELSIVGGVPYGDGSYNYDWGGPLFGRSSDPGLIRIGPGDYSVTITDSLGCQVEEIFTLHATPVITSILGVSPSLCEGVDVGEIVVSAHGGRPFPGNSYTFDLRGNDFAGNPISSRITSVSVAVFSGLPAGTYLVQALDDNPSGLCDPLFSDTTTIGNSLPPNSLSYFSDLNSNCSSGSQQLSIYLDNYQHLTPPVNVNIYNEQGLLVEGYMNLPLPQFTTGCLPSGQYRVEVTDEVSCTIVGTFSLPLDCDISLNTLIEETFCPFDGFGSIDLSATTSSHPLGYLWSTGSTEDRIDNLFPGTYAVTVTDTIGCALVDSFTINHSSLISVILSPRRSRHCFDASTDIEVVNAPGAGIQPFIYIWEPDSIGTPDGHILQDVPPGTYTVTIIDDNGFGCPVVESITIEDLTPPDYFLSAPIDPLSEHDGQSISMTVIPNDDFRGPFNFEASSGESDSSAIVFTPIDLSPGTNWIIYSTLSGCFFDTVFFDVPILTPYCRVRDSLALVSLYNATDGPNWTNTWDLHQSMDSWYGVGLTEDGCVNCLDMDGQFDCRKSVNSGGNKLMGYIPSELGVMDNLTLLSLSWNELSRAIPPELGHLSNLEILELSWNKLSGPLPAELGNLTSLEELWISVNKLTGPIPPELGQLSNLTWLFLSHNELSGSIPSELGQMNNLLQLELSQNNLSGIIPPELGDLSKLERMTIIDNELRGAVPSELGQLSNLRSLWLSNNNLSGPIPGELGAMGKLEHLLLSQNELSGSIPHTLGGLNKLRLLALSKNNLSGTIPDELGELENIEVLKIDNNNLSGCIPANLMKICYLTSERVRENCEGDLQKCQYDFRYNFGLAWQGDFDRYCKGENQIGAPCEDGNPLTFDDRITEDCQCKGTEEDRPVPGFIYGPEIVCKVPFTLSVVGGPFEEYYWSTGAISQEVELYEPGWYSVVAVTSAGVKDTLGILVEDGRPEVNISGTKTICDDETTTLTAIADREVDYFWSNGGIGSIISDVGPGIYSVTVETDSGCRSSDTVQVSNSSGQNAALYIPNVFAPEEVMNNAFTLSTDNYCAIMDIEVDILNGSNRSIYKNVIVPEGNIIVLWDGSDVIDPCSNAQGYKYKLVINLLNGNFKRRSGELCVWRCGDIANICGDLTIPDLRWPDEVSDGVFNPNVGEAPSIDDDLSCIDSSACAGSAIASGSTIAKLIVPNGNGINQNLHIGIENPREVYPNNQLLIFNKWGRVLYEAAPYDNQWSGTNVSGNDLPAGTYYLLFRTRDNSNINLGGSVTIIR